jgi:hypothetical protein
MYTFSRTGQGSFEWIRANVLVRVEAGGVRFSKGRDVKSVAFCRDSGPDAWLSPAGDWLVLVSRDGLVASDTTVQLRWRHRTSGQGVVGLYFRPPFLVVFTRVLGERYAVATLDLKSGMREDAFEGPAPWPTWRQFMDARLDLLLDARDSRRIASALSRESQVQFAPGFAFRHSLHFRRFARYVFRATTGTRIAFRTLKWASSPCSHIR